MALTPAGQAAKDRLDQDLQRGPVGINVKLGQALYAELLTNNMLPILHFEALGFGHMFPHTSYQTNFAFCGYELPPYEFRLGDGGHVP